MKKNFLFFWFLFVSCECYSQLQVHDDFESPVLNKIWSTDRMELHSFEIQSKIVRKGKSAGKITLRTGDVVEPANDSSLASERDELQEADHLFSDENKKYEYKFSLYIPDSFLIVPTRLIIAQWKQKCPSNKECSDNSPILAIRYQSGKLFITLNDDSGRKRLFELKNDCRDRWLDFKFQILFSKTNGEIEGFLNDSNIISYKGSTCYSQKPGYNLKNNKFYFKMGLYRDRMPEPMFIYLDEYEKSELKSQ